VFEIPGYKIERELGHGGMAAVYLAFHEFTKRQVAIKVMSPALAADPSFSERFLKEATCANLAHPNIVTVYDAGEIDKQNYIVMEYASGGDFAHAIRNGLTIYDSVKVVKQIAAALAYAHERGYVHRDVKPDNVLLRGDGTAVLVDFGIAKASSANTRMTAVGMTIGSPHYMSPEQARGKELDGRSDIYSLGIVLYEALTGRKPYDAEDTYAIAYMHVNEPLPQLPATFAYMQPILDKMLAKEPAQRYPDAHALLQALENVQPPPGPARASMATTVLMSADTAPPRPAPQSKSPMILAVAGAAIAAALGAGFYFMPAADTPVATETAPVAPADPQLAERKRLEEQAAAEQQRIAAEQSARQQRITDLLAQADGYAKANALTKPAGANALDAYRQVLALDPGNATAADGLVQIARNFLALATGRKSKGDLAGALALANDGLAVAPDDTGLLNLKSELDRNFDRRKQDIETRLARADGYAASGALIEPADANAYAEYQSVLKLDARNRRAQQGTTVVAERVAANIERALGEERLDQAETQLNAARAALGNTPRLAALSDRLAQAKRDRDMAELRRKEEQQRQAMLDEQRRMLDELKKAQAELAEARAAPGRRTAAPNQLAIAKQGKIALAVRFIAAPKSPSPTDELIRKTSGMMRTVLSEFVPEDTQYDVVSDNAVTARIASEGDAAAESRKICSDRKAEYVLGSLMEDHAGRPERKTQIVLFDCASNRRSSTSVMTSGQERIRTIRDALEPFLRSYVTSQR
jgi:tRNA A-37 threonylcarbamoyl transferase component Bud32